MQAALKTVLEPIFEADFLRAVTASAPRRAQDAIAEIHHFSSRSHEWVLEGDITACFDEIDHTASWSGSERIGDRRVLELVKASSRPGSSARTASVGHEHGHAPGRHLSPLLANIALRVLDDHFAEAWATLGPPHLGKSVDAKGWPPTASSATWTISWFWCRHLVSTPRGLQRGRWRRGQASGERSLRERERSFRASTQCAGAPHRHGAFRPPGSPSRAMQHRLVVAMIGLQCGERLRQSLPSCRPGRSGELRRVRPRADRRFLE